MAGSSNTLRAVLNELGWSRTRLVAELRRQAATSGDTLPGTESLIAMVSRWVNNHQQPSDFYRELLARTLGWPRIELFSDETARLELAAEAEPWLLARALEVSSAGQAALEALEEAALPGLPPGRLLMASCDVLYYDPTQVGQPRRDPAGHPLGPASDGWQPCTAPGQAWTDPDLVLRWICVRHRRQLVALHAAGLAGQVRWQQPGLSTGPAPSREATP